MQRTYVKHIISLLLLGVVYAYIPEGYIAETLSRISASHLMLPALAIFASFVVASYRFYALTRQFAFSLSFKSAHFINIMSYVSGIVMFQTLGQVISRAGISSFYTANPQRMVLLTFLEKGASFLSLFVIAIVGAFSIVHTIHVDLVSLGPILTILTAVAISLVPIGMRGMTPSERRYLRRSFALVLKVRFGFITLTSAVVHGLTLAGYVLIAHAFLPEVSLPLLTAAFTVVMLGAAFPISFAGWGVRELTAGFVFSTLSLDPAIGVVVAGLVGVISLLAVVAHGLLCTTVLKNEKVTSFAKSSEGHEKFHFERLIAFICGTAVALLIGSQTQIATATSKMTVNLADPFALIGGLTFMAFWYFWHKGNAIWRIPYMSLGLGLFAAMILLGWLWGFASYGSGSWASVNRGFGLVFVMSYLASGAMFTAFFGRRSIFVVLRVMFFISATAYLLFWIALNLQIYPFNWNEGMNWYPHQFSGLAFNRNAFAFQMVMVFAVLISAPRSSKSLIRDMALAGVAFLILASGSRSGILAIALMSAAAFVLRTIEWRSVLRVVGLVALFVTIEWGGHVLMEPIARMVHSTPRDQNLVGHLANIDMLEMQYERIYSYIGALRMWRENPLFGGGLGAFISSQDHPLVIHNTVLWVMAEMGGVGLMMWLFLPVALVSYAARNGLRRVAWEDAALLLCLLGAFSFSLFHEIYYQRALWFFIGLLASSRWVLQPGEEPSTKSP
ncbi:MAG: flippase-like domain-containing protein [Alphaproteobacteria bacterium]|nr:flippase-like domain-containing protein [Alphaproteobacteria bacterium]